MNEIEKMYENAGLLYCNKCRHDSELDCLYMCENKYPSFTAEKQIELIKWLVDTDNYIKEICRMIDTRRYCIETLYKNISMANNFEEALAGLINNLWQNLTEEEKQQIKEILE